jgi:hypothetical protein
LIPSKKLFSFSLSEQDEDIFDYISKEFKELHQSDVDMPTELSVDKYQLLIKRLPSAANNPRYIRIQHNASLRKSLDGLTIVEHPTIYCVPNENMSDFPIGTTGITEESPTIPPAEDSTIP